MVDLLPIPEFGTPVAVADGIFWLRVRLPFALNHVNLWLCDDGEDGWTLVDTGYGDAPTRQVWQELLAGPLLAGRPVRRVLATHFHPDHLGQAGWLCGRTGASLWMSRTEWLTGRLLALDDTTTFVDENERAYRRAGMPEAAVLRQRERGNAYRRGVSEPPPAFVRIKAEDRIHLAGTSWRVLIGEGHAPEQVTLFSAERRLLIAADQILPKISPVVGVWSSQPDADPLRDFLGSLDQYRALPEDCRILPSHGAPFLGLHARLAQLAQHHEERLAATLDACAAEPVTTAAVLRCLFPRELDAHQTGFALAETLAHLNHLLGQGRLVRWREAEGTDRWRCR
jgi:glyoxylase-like metal-dependent hydrolase (beta-lactamase superfamily II)